MNTAENVKINEDAVEPKDYFEILKTKKKTQTNEKLKNQLDGIAEHIIEAKKINQKKFLEQLAFSYQSIIKEQTLLCYDIDQYMYKDDIKYFIDNVKPANSIKIIELDRYPRAIPLDVMNKISVCQENNLFDDYIIVFTDFSDNDYKSTEEKQLVARNRDPIVFGYFKHEDTGLKHDRFYYIADWEDEHCDLTFTKLIEKMGNMGMKNVNKTITNDTVYLNEIVNNTLDSMTKKKSTQTAYQTKIEEPKSFFERFKERFTK